MALPRCPACEGMGTKLLGKECRDLYRCIDCNFVFEKEEPTPYSGPFHVTVKEDLKQGDEAYVSSNSEVFKVPYTRADEIVFKHGMRIGVKWSRKFEEFRAEDYPLPENVLERAWQAFKKGDWLP